MSDSNYYSDDEECELFGFDDVSDMSEGMRYRSIAVESNRPVQHMGISIMDPAATNMYLHPKPVVVASSISDCPCSPFGISKNNFVMLRPTYAVVKESLDDFLRSQVNIDFIYLEGEFMWKGKYLKGSSCFEVEINLYHDTAPEDTFTVAVRKVSCDSSVNNIFNTFFNEMKAALCNDPATVNTPAPPAKKRFCIPTNCSLVTITDDDFLNGVQSIFRMCECSSLETRVQGAKMLCDLSLKSAHFLELPAFAPRCAALLETLVHDEVDDVRQHAVMAVAAFAELDSYREAFLRSDVLPALFQLVENCQYETAQMRRTAAAVLALLCRTHPYSVRNELRQHDHCVDLNAWLQRAPLLQDARTRESALVVKACLEEGGVPAAADCDCDQHLHGGLMSEEEATLFALSH